MLFNSYEYLFLFLPLTLIVYFLLNRTRYIVVAKLWLILASLFFYSWWNIKYLPLMISSIVFNFVIGKYCADDKLKVNLWKVNLNNKFFLICGIAGDLILLGYFKYADFFINNTNHILHVNIGLLNIIIPLGISFFTFTQIAYLVDAYNSDVKEYSFVNYSLFVTYFPHLLAGPIIHHREMMPQFDRLKNKIINHKNLSMGIFLFFIGFFKKIVVADTFAEWAKDGFDVAKQLTLFHAWFTSLSYSMQIYFDFSGYTDMALGSSLMFNIKLPINFNTPYKSLNIQEFWRRWHITLSRFLRDYVYIPLGGNRTSEPKILFNLMSTFLIGGLWHGAGWTFVFWGFLHGAATVIHRMWRNFNINMPKFLALFLTFNFVNIAWIFFRAKSWDDAIKVLKGMFGFNGLGIPAEVFELKERIVELSSSEFQASGIHAYRAIVRILTTGNFATLWMILIFIVVAICFNNSNEMTEDFKPNWQNALFTICLVVFSTLCLGRVSDFIYFNF
jgi:alginate O-acetyltransferase complex protein AlgI